MTGTERKCFQKYYPADFDPSKIPKSNKSQKNRDFVQRVMVPFNMQCNSCSEYIYKGRKFNMERETVEGETYLGLKLFRFRLNCPNCLAHITFKTDLENCDYQNEHGATRLFDGEEKRSEESEDVKDPMKILEKRQKQSLLEMKNIEELEDLQESNRGKEGVDAMGLLEMESSRKREIQEEEDEKTAKEILEKSKNSAKAVKDIVVQLKPTIPESSSASKRKNEQKDRFAGIKLVKKADATSSKSSIPASSSSGLGFLAGYESGSDSE